MTNVRRALLLAALVGCAGESADQASQRDSTAVPGSRSDPASAGDERYLVAVLESSDSTVPGGAGTHLVFSNGDTLVVPARDVRFHRWLMSESAGPWLVVSGVECSECDAPASVYLVKARAGVLPRGYVGYPYPGPVIATVGSSSQQPHFRSRMFVGACLADHGSGAVIVEAHLDPNGAVTTRGVRVIVIADTPLESEHSWSESLEHQISDAVSRRQCHELSGIPQYIF